MHCTRWGIWIVIFMVVKMGLVCNIVFMSKSQGWVSIIQMICVFDLTYEMLSHIDWSNANSSRILIITAEAMCWLL